MSTVGNADAGTAPTRLSCGMHEPTRMTVQVTDTEADDEHLEDLTRRLLEELLNLDVPVGAASAAQAPSVTDDAARRAFALYWLLIRGPSGLIRRSWLAAIDRRATA